MRFFCEKVNTSRLKYGYSLRSLMKRLFLKGILVVSDMRVNL